MAALEVPKVGFVGAGAAALVEGAAELEGCALAAVLAPRLNNPVGADVVAGAAAEVAAGADA